MDFAPEALEFLKSQHVGVVSTAAAGGELWSTVVYYLSGEDGNVSFYTKNRTKKYGNLSANAKVAFIVFDQAKRITLQISGEANEVTDQREVNLFFDRLERTVGMESRPLPIEKLRNAGDYVVIRITPKNNHFADYSKL